ncbi:MAG: VOC family protein [Paracoccaceae bacterium]|nr:VOC family protein [Paracoccaceae bacterium]
MPVLPTRDVDTTARFYADVLGFDTNGFFRDGDGPAFFAIVGLGTVTIGLQKLETFSVHEGTVAYIYVDDAQALARRIADAGGVLRHEPHETFYGILEFDLVDPEGHVIAFGQDLNPGPDGPGL